MYSCWKKCIVSDKNILKLKTSCSLSITNYLFIALLIYLIIASTYVYMYVLYEAYYHCKTKHKL